MCNERYVLITAAYNEAAVIEKTINSILSQTLKPQRWVIVSDGSNDSTDEIILRYSQLYNFIKYFRINKKGQHDFCSKVNAINKGYEILGRLDFDYIGNLDADIVLPLNYYQKLIIRLKRDKRIGIASGVYIEKIMNKTVRFRKPDYHTPGSIQFFRRECYQEIGGYPMLNGGEDVAAGVLARMCGWKTQSFTDLEALHLKPLLTGSFKKVLNNRLRLGESDYNLGMHPTFATLKLLKQIAHKPYLIGGIFLYCGYLNAMVNRKKRVVSKKFINYFRREQLSRLRDKIRKAGI